MVISRVVKEYQATHVICYTMYENRYQNKGNKYSIKKRDIVNDISHIVVIPVSREIAELVWHEILAGRDKEKGGE